MTSRLFYFGTGEEMRPGDRIAIRSSGSDEVCTVECIRGDVTDSGLSNDEWDFQTDDGVLHVVDFGAGQDPGQVGRNIRLVCRAGGEVEAAAEALNYSNEKHPPVSWWDAFSFFDLGCGVVSVLVVIVNLLVWLLR